MSDLIRREDLFELMMRHKPIDNGDGSKERYAYIEWLGIYHAIRELPSADRPQEWIPCSERLPSEQGQYLVTFPLCNGEPWVYILSFNKGKFYETDDEWGDVDYDDVTAWMSLPEPYTADTPQTEREGE